LSTTLSEAQKRLLRSTSLAHLGTINPDGSPQVTPIWVDVEDDRPVFNTAVGRRKERNLRRDPRVTIEMTDPDDPYSYIEIRGTAELDEEGAEDHIDFLAHKYLGVDSYPNRRASERRIKVYVTPTSVFGRVD
jgi:PPOX class probable F420-dependent enzyme